jgi:hypothetical protein
MRSDYERRLVLVRGPIERPTAGNKAEDRRPGAGVDESVRKEIVGVKAYRGDGPMSSRVVGEGYIDPLPGPDVTEPEEDTQASLT